MIDPVSAATAVASIGSAITGASNQRKANQQAALRNAKEMQLLERQQAMAEELQRAGFATQIDAQGNVTYYDPATNTWKTSLTAEQQQIQDASDREELNQYSVDAPLARGELLNAAARRSREASTADTQLHQINSKLSGATDYKGSNMASALRLSRGQAVNAAFDDTANMMNKQALRSGATGSAAAGGRFAKARASALSQTMGAPEIEGRQLADDMNNTNMSSSMSNYGAMAGRATGAPGWNGAPSNITESLRGALASSRQASMSGLNGAGAMFGAGANGVRNATQVGQNNPWEYIMAGIDGVSSSGVLKKKPAKEPAF